jgi:tetratricopeptide (TPR) repeat protein
MLRTELASGEKARMVPGETVARMKLELALTESDSLAPDTLSKIHANIGADYVVLGSYFVVGKGKLRIDLRLQDTARGELLTSSAAEGTEDELFAMVSTAGARLRESLALGAVSPVEASAVRASFPSNPEAARLYAQGLGKLRVFDPEDAKTLLAKAAEAEPRHPLIRAALAQAWSALGYDARAREEAKSAFDLAKDLPREERLGVEALFHETSGDWDKAVETHKALLVFFPDKVDYALRLAAAQTSAGRAKEALESVEAMRRLPRPASDDPRIDLAEAAAAKALTDFPRQQRAAAAAAAGAQKQEARLLVAQARLSEGSALVNMGQLEEARRASEEAATIFAAAGDKAGVARSENIVAVSYAQAGDMKSARARFEKALAAFRQTGDRRGIATQLANVSTAASRMGQVAEARRLAAEALAVSREVQDKEGIARGLNNVAALLEQAGQLEPALKQYEEALAAYEELGAKRNVAVVTANIGEILQKQKKLDAARERYEASLKISRAIGASADATVTLSLLADLHEQNGDPGAAVRALTESLPLLRQDEDLEGEVKALWRISKLQERRGDKAGAAAAAEQAKALETKLQAKK